MKKLRTFEHFPQTSRCPICDNSEDGECCLVPIIGTQEGTIVEAIPIHTGCLSLVYDKKNNIIYQSLERK